MNLIPIIIGAVALILACVNQRSLWRVTRAWQYRNPDAVEPSDAALVWSRVGLVLAGVFLIVIPIIVTVSNNNDKKSAAHASAQASQAQASANTEVQQQTDQQTASLEQEGTKVLTTIMQHTPAGKSPRSIPLFQVNTLLPELQQSEYNLSANGSYPSTGQITITSLNYTLAGAVCINVPDHVITSAQIAAGSYVGTGAMCG